MSDYKVNCIGRQLITFRRIIIEIHEWIYLFACETETDQYSSNAYKKNLILLQKPYRTAKSYVRYDTFF